MSDISEIRARMRDLWQRRRLSPAKIAAALSPPRHRNVVQRWLEDTEPANPAIWLEMATIVGITDPRAEEMAKMALELALEVVLGDVEKSKSLAARIIREASSRYEDKL